MALPTIVFVHGAWHWPGFFTKVKNILETKGYRTIVLALPSVGRTPPVSSLNEDIFMVRTAVLKELDAGYNVVINAHSWGGIVATNSLDGLSKKEREAIGQTTSVTKLTFVSAFVLPEGVSLFDAVGGKENATWLKIKDGNMMPDGALEVMYHDCDPEEAADAVSNLKVHAEATFDEKTRTAAWRRIPSAYLVCEDDRAIPLAGQEAMIQTVKDEGGVIEVERIAFAHSPYIGKPEPVAAFIDRAARGEGQEVPR